MKTFQVLLYLITEMRHCFSFFIFKKAVSEKILIMKVEDRCQGYKTDQENFTSGQ